MPFFAGVLAVKGSQIVPRMAMTDRPEDLARVPQLARKPPSAKNLSPRNLLAECVRRIYDSLVGDSMSQTAMVSSLHSGHRIEHLTGNLRTSFIVSGSFHWSVV